MKAEQRKELETNALADKMGRVVQRVKGSPRNSFTGYFILAAIVLVAGFLVYRWWATGQFKSSEGWVNIYEGGAAQLDPLIKEEPTSAAGKIARFQVAYLMYWDKGVKKLGLDAKDAVQRLRDVGEEYERLATDCKDDPIFEPQALLGKAVVEETLAVQNRNRLDKAKQYYDDVIKKYKDSVQGKIAKERFDELNDPKKLEIVAHDYQQLARMLDPARRVLGQDANRAPLGDPVFDIDKNR